MNDYTYKIDNGDPSEKKNFIRRMFDSIAPTYDLLNRLLSMGIDRSWRNHLLKMAGNIEGARVLDLCCGTGDLSKLFSKKKSWLVALDFSFEMLLAGRAKGWLGTRLVSADASRLPFKSGSFDILSIAFGIRNIPDIERFLNECSRVLAPGGKLYILELTRPKNPVVLLFYNIYLKIILPVIGGAVSGKMSAYRYLAKTIETFIDPQKLSELIAACGFTKIAVVPRTSGIATIFECVK